MNNIVYTIIHFDYGGSYSKNEDGESFRWISRESQVYTLLIKRSMEDVTYSELVDRICRKIVVAEEAMTKLKLTYIPLFVKPQRPSIILDDDDVFGYLMEVNKDQCRSVLHVELIQDVEQNQNYEHLSRNDRGTQVEVICHDVPTSFSRVGVSNPSHVRDVDVVSVGNDAITNLNTKVVPSEHYELLDNVDITHGENVLCEEVAIVDNNDDISEDLEPTPDVEAYDCLNHPWEDGIDITLGQEFASKQAVQDLVDKASLYNCFEVATIKSCSALYVLKCRQANYGCKWYLRVAKLKNSDCLSVRTHNKMHTCSRVTTSTSGNKRKATPQLVASILHEDYSDQLDTLTPKNLIGLVQEKFGVKVSYATALRGKKKAVNDVRESPKER